MHTHGRGIQRVQKGIQRKVSPAKGVLCIYKKLDGGITLYTGFCAPYTFHLTQRPTSFFKAA